MKYHIEKNSVQETLVIPLYGDLKDPSVSGFFRFLAKVGNRPVKMQIVRLISGKA